MPLQDRRTKREREPLSGALAGAAGKKKSRPSAGPAARAACRPPVDPAQQTDLVEGLKTSRPPWNLRQRLL